MAVAVLQAVAARFEHQFEFTEALIGGAAIDATGSPLPPRTIAACRDSDAVLLGAVGGPQWSDPGARVRPEQGLLELRGTLGLFANLRPVRVLPSMLDASPLKPEVVRGRRHHGRARTDRRDLLRPQEAHGPRGRGRLQLHHRGDRTRHARRRRSSRWCAAGAWYPSTRRTCSKPRDSGARWSSAWSATSFRSSRSSTCWSMRRRCTCCARRAAFDVLLTENMFGDILTDEASMLAGSLGLLPSASLGSHEARCLRADTRLGARHRRTRDRESLRRHPECRAAAATLARTRRRGARRRDRRRPGAGRGRPHGRHGQPGQTALGSAAVRDEVVQLLQSDQ